MLAVAMLHKYTGQYIYYVQTTKMKKNIGIPLNKPWKQVAIPNYTVGYALEQLSLLAGL